MLPLQDTKTAGRIPYMTIGLIVFTVYVFYLQISAPNTEIFIRQYALIPKDIHYQNQTSLWPFLTAIFLHGSFLHILSNMLFLWVFGDNVERVMGLWFLPFYLFAGAVANYGQYVLMPNSDIALLGASGAIAGVLGAYLVLFPQHSIKTLVPIFFFITVVNIPAYILLIFWFVLQLFSGAASINSGSFNGGVAYFAHISGFVLGVLVGIILLKTGRPRRRLPAG